MTVKVDSLKADANKVSMELSGDAATLGTIRKAFEYDAYVQVSKVTTLMTGSYLTIAMQNYTMWLPAPAKEKNVTLDADQRIAVSFRMGMKRILDTIDASGILLDKPFIQVDADTRDALYDFVSGVMILKFIDSRNITLTPHMQHELVNLYVKQAEIYGVPDRIAWDDPQTAVIDTVDPRHNSGANQMLQDARKRAANVARDLNIPGGNNLRGYC